METRAAQAKARVRETNDGTGAPDSGGSPDIAEDALEVCAENLFDDGGGLAAASETFCDDFQMGRAAEVGDPGIAVFAGRTDVQLFPPGDVGVEGGFLFGGESDGLDGAVAADADVIGAADVDGVDQVIENVLMRGDRGRCHEIGHEINAEVAAAADRARRMVSGLLRGCG